MARLDWCSATPTDTRLFPCTDAFHRLHPGHRLLHTLFGDADQEGVMPVRIIGMAQRVLWS